MTKKHKVQAGDLDSERSADGALSSPPHYTQNGIETQPLDPASAQRLAGWRAYREAQRWLERRRRGAGYWQRWREKARRQVRPRRRGGVDNE